MLEASADLSTPPRWTRALLRSVLAPSSMCGMILGDLHEEFVRDARRLGGSKARSLYRRRALGVVVYALRDSVCLRGWIRSRSSGRASSEAELHPGVTGDAPASIVDPRFLAVLVVVVGIGVNTAVYTMMESSIFPQWFVSVVGAVGFLFVLACAALASGMVCDALRRRGERAGRRESRLD